MQPAPHPDDFPAFLAYRLQAFLEKNADQPDWIVAVSSGLDSTVLLHALAAAYPRERIFPVHLNYHLRGQESDQDQAFIEEFCRSLGLECEVVHLDPKEVEAGGNIQDWARRARYDWLMTGPRPRPCAVLTAHHAQDQVETILYRILNGYPPHLCTGMELLNYWKGSRPLVRPLLDVAPRFIRQYAEAQGLSWREDASNQTDAYARNRIRRHLLPALGTAIGPDWQSNLLSFARQLNNMAFVDAAEMGMDAYGNLRLPLESLAKARYPGRILSRLTGQYVSPGRAHEVIRTLTAGRLKAFRTDLGTFMRDRDDNVLFIPQTRLNLRYEIAQLPVTHRVPTGQTVTLEPSIAPALEDLPAEARNGIFYLNLEPPFSLRRPHRHDRIALIGRQGETNIHDLLEKQPFVFIRETAWVLEKEGRIAFVSPNRVARRAAVQPGWSCIKLVVE